MRVITRTAKECSQVSMLQPQLKTTSVHQRPVKTLNGWSQHMFGIIGSFEEIQSWYLTFIYPKKFSQPHFIQCESISSTCTTFSFGFLHDFFFPPWKGLRWDEKKKRKRGTLAGRYREAFFSLNVLPLLPWFFFQLPSTIRKRVPRYVRFSEDDKLSISVKMSVNGFDYVDPTMGYWPVKVTSTWPCQTFIMSHDMGYNASRQLKIGDETPHLSATLLAQNRETFVLSDIGLTCVQTAVLRCHGVQRWSTGAPWMTKCCFC